MLAINPTPQVTTPTRPIVSPANRKNGTLMSFFWQADPPQYTVFTLPSSSVKTVLEHLQAKQSIAPLDFLYAVPWPEQLFVVVMQDWRVGWQIGRMPGGSGEADAWRGRTSEEEGEEAVDGAASGSSDCCWRVRSGLLYEPYREVALRLEFLEAEGMRTIVYESDPLFRSRSRIKDRISERPVW